MPVISNTPRFTRNTQLNASRSGPAEPPLDTPGVGTYSIPSSLKIEFGETATFGEPLTDRGLMFAPIRTSCLFYPVDPFCPGRPYERSGSSPESHRIWARCWNRQQRNSNSCERCTSLLADFVALPTALGEEAAGPVHQYGQRGPSCQSGCAIHGTPPVQAGGTGHRHGRGKHRAEAAPPPRPSRVLDY